MENQMSLEELVNELSPELRQEVEDFIRFLLEKRKKTRSQPTFEWAGALKDAQGQYTAVELQHKASEWRIEE